MKRSGEYFVYIMTNARQTVLYTGVTSDLSKRVYQHKHKSSDDSFTSRYNVDKLVYFEQASSPEFAILREKQIKAGSRKKKVALIESMNKDWKDLSEVLTGLPRPSGPQ